MKKGHFHYPLIVLVFFIVFAQSILASTFPNLVGESAILMERNTGAILYKKNAYIQMYPASTTKILTSILGIESMDLNSTMSKTSQSVQIVPSNSSHIGLRVGDKFSVLDGIYAIMLGSDNYVAHDLAITLDGSIENFAIRMNQKAKELGAKSSNFVNPHGYHHPKHYTTAYDLAVIANYAFNNATFTTIAKTPMHTLQRLNDPKHPIEFLHTVKLLQPDSTYYFPYTIGGKTGYNTPAGRCLVAVANKGDVELIGVVLKSTTPEFFEDMISLFEYGFENFIFDKEKNLLENVSFSPWAKDTIALSQEKEIIDMSITKNYKSYISKKDFAKLLIRTIYISQAGGLDGFSNEFATDNALDWGLIKNSSPISRCNEPITREEAAYSISQLLSYLRYQPVVIYPQKMYQDNDAISKDLLSSIYHLQQAGLMGSHKDIEFNPQRNLTLEEGISLAIKLYQSYANSPSRFINKSRLFTN